MKIIIVFNYGDIEFTNFDKVVRTLENEFGLRRSSVGYGVASMNFIFFNHLAHFLYDKESLFYLAYFTNAPIVEQASSLLINFCINF